MIKWFLSFTLAGFVTTVIVDMLTKNTPEEKEADRPVERRYKLRVIQGGKT